MASPQQKLSLSEEPTLHKEVKGWTPHPRIELNRWRKGVSRQAGQRKGPLLRCPLRGVIISWETKASVRRRAEG